MGGLQWWGLEWRKVVTGIKIINSLLVISKGWLGPIPILKPRARLTGSSFNATFLLWTISCPQITIIYSPWFKQGTG